MRLLLTAILALGLVVPGYAQQETLISGDVSFGGFGGPVLGLTGINGQPALLVGGRGGVVINFRELHSLGIGGGGTGLVTNVPADGVFNDDGEQMYLALGYGGVDLEYTHRTNRLVHVTAQTLIGAGGVSHRRKDYEDFDNDVRNSDPFFVFEPGVNAELNVTTFFRIGVGITYRFVSGVDLAGVNDNELSGVTGTTTFKFGGF